MKKILLSLVCYFGLIASYSQSVLKPTIGIGPLPNDADSVCHIPFYLNGSYLSGFHVGDTVPDFTLYNLNGDSLNLKTALSTGKPALLISGSYTCPITRGNIAHINNVVTTYGNQVNVYLIYVVEVHPAIDTSPYFGVVNTNNTNIQAGILYRQPTTYGERKAMVSNFLDSMTILAPIYIDGPCNNWWLNYGPAQNNATLIDTNGVVFAKHGWYNRAPDNIVCDIDSLLGNPVTCQPVGMFNYNFLSVDTIAVGNAGDTISCNGTLVNNTAYDVPLKIARRISDVPSTWTSGICLDVCDTSVTDTVSFLLAAGATQPFQFYFCTSPGIVDTGHVRLKFWNEGDANNRFYQHFYGVSNVSVYNNEWSASALNLHIYPNPAKDNFTIFLTANKYFDAEITDVTGRSVYELTNVTGKAVVNCKQLPNGIYFVRASTETKEIYYQRIVISRNQ